MSGLVVDPFDHSRYVGTVCRVRPGIIEINLPHASTPNGSHVAGFPLMGGQVGEFVVVEGEEHAVLGRIFEVRLPERDRLSVEFEADTHQAPHPIGVVQLLTAVDLRTGNSLKGIPVSPRVSQYVYSAHPLMLKQAIEASALADAKKVQLAVFPHAQNTSVAMDPAHIFGRHCAVLGATGGGKSWTTAHLVEEIARLGGKAILFDATGEYANQAAGVTHVHLGGEKEDANDPRTFVGFPYTELTDTDLFVLFRPSPGVQAPKFREALRSLKLAYLNPELAEGGLIKKQGKVRAPFEAAAVASAQAVSAHGALFDISLLSAQINEECVFPQGFGANVTSWGGPTQNEVSACVTLMSRIESDLASPSLACIFKTQDLENLPDVIEQFIADPAQRILRVSLEFLSFEHNARELVANAVGRYLLNLSRAGRFEKLPLVVLLDEAHQFLDKSLGDEFSRTDLEAFGLIAKEGRKYGLTCVLATQRPRDIPEDVLSQMGMFIVHRLINERDRAVVEKACGNLDAGAAAFLPTLGQGEAIIVGVDSPMPLPVQINAPRVAPKSNGANYGDHWQPYVPPPHGPPV
ncbi:MULTISPECIES: ATP-binding protein [unclassified Luteibacter]|uniref:ATP-binding protein n=1 Tax=Luteibacter sp. PvP019 TaxID=3156436 RepID=UPI0033911842